MINNLVGYTAVVLEDVKIGCTGCEGDLLSDGLFFDFPSVSTWVISFMDENLCARGNGSFT